MREQQTTQVQSSIESLRFTGNNASKVGLDKANPKGSNF